MSDVALSISIFCFILILMYLCPNENIHADLCQFKPLISHVIIIIFKKNKNSIMYFGPPFFFVFFFGIAVEIFIKKIINYYKILNHEMFVFRGVHWFVCCFTFYVIVLWMYSTIYRLLVIYNTSYSAHSDIKLKACRETTVVSFQTFRRSFMYLFLHLFLRLFVFIAFSISLSI